MTRKNFRKTKKTKRTLDVVPFSQNRGSDELLGHDRAVRRFNGSSPPERTAICEVTAFHRIHENGTIEPEPEFLLVDPLYPREPPVLLQRIHEQQIHEQEIHEQRIHEQRIHEEEPNTWILWLMFILAVMFGIWYFMVGNRF